MAGPQAEIMALVVKFIEALKGRIPLELVILFGSHAYGVPGPESDIDLAVVSPVFGRNPWDDRKIIYETIISAGLDPRIEAHPFAPQDLQKSSRMLARNILDKGIVVYQRSTDQRR